MKDISKLSQDISKWTNKIDLSVIRAVKETGQDVYNDVMKLAPENTGKYKESIYVEEPKVETGKVSVFIGTDMVLETRLLHKRYNLGRMLENGTRPHIILPVDPDGYLHFIARDGTEVFTKIVHHPGFREIPHFTPALMKNRRNFKKKLKLAIKEARK